eukprot:Phypoly_transcript_01303.p1 GENE.Phypoly_transcript_01303~~Phypoly_transcript_01303.p1  ORF type:complete len:1128 (+),score=236.90 Phypoly_transcript_01303:27-3410(+)
MVEELDEEVILSHFVFSESFSHPSLLAENEIAQSTTSTFPLQPTNNSASHSITSQLDNEIEEEYLTPTQLVNREEEVLTPTQRVHHEADEVLTPTQRVHHEIEEVLTPTQRVHHETEEVLTPTQRVHHEVEEVSTPTKRVFKEEENVPPSPRKRIQAKHNTPQILYFESPIKLQGRSEDYGIIRRTEESLKRKIDDIDPSVYSILVSQSFLQNKRERGKYSSSDFDFKATLLPKNEIYKEIPGWYHRKKTQRNQTLLCTSMKEKIRPPQCQFHSPSNHSIFFSHRWLPDDRSTFEADLVEKLEKETQQRIFYDKNCLRTGHIINRFLGSLYDCKVILLYINDWTMKIMKDKLFKGEEDYVFLEWQLACLHTMRGGTVIPILEGVTLAELRTLPVTSYPTIALEEMEDKPYSHIGEWLSYCVAITISPTDPATIQPLCDAILKALGNLAVPPTTQTWPPPQQTALRTTPITSTTFATPSSTFTTPITLTTLSPTSTLSTTPTTTSASTTTSSTSITSTISTTTPMTPTTPIPTTPIPTTPIATTSAPTPSTKSTPPTKPSRALQTPKIEKSASVHAKPAFKYADLISQPSLLSTSKPTVQPSLLSASLATSQPSLLSTSMPNQQSTTQVTKYATQPLQSTPKLGQIRPNPQYTNAIIQTNIAPQSNNSAPQPANFTNSSQTTNSTSQTTNSTSQTTNSTPQITHSTPQITHSTPQIAHSTTQITHSTPQTNSTTQPTHSTPQITHYSAQNTNSSLQITHSTTQTDFTPQTIPAPNTENMLTRSQSIPQATTQSHTQFTHPVSPVRSSLRNSTPQIWSPVQKPIVPALIPDPPALQQNTPPPPLFQSSSPLSSSLNLPPSLTLPPSINNHAQTTPPSLLLPSSTVNQQADSLQAPLPLNQQQNTPSHPSSISSPTLPLAIPLSTSLHLTPPALQVPHLGYQSARGIYSLRDYILPTNPYQIISLPTPSPHTPSHGTSPSINSPYLSLSINYPSPYLTPLPSTSPSPTSLHTIELQHDSHPSTTHTPPTLTTHHSTLTIHTTPQQLGSPMAPPQAIPLMAHTTPQQPSTPTSLIQAHPTYSPVLSSALSLGSSPSLLENAVGTSRKRVLHESHDFGGENLNRFKTLRISQ